MTKLILILSLSVLLSACGMSGATFSAGGSAGGSSSGGSSSGGSSSGGTSGLLAGGSTSGGSSPSTPTDGDINPEPATLAMFGIGLSGLALAALKKKTNSDKHR